MDPQKTSRKRKKRAKRAKAPKRAEPKPQEPQEPESPETPQREQMLVLQIELLEAKRETLLLQHSDWAARIEAVGSDLVHLPAHKKALAELAVTIRKSAAEEQGDGSEAGTAADASEV